MDPLLAHFAPLSPVTGNLANVRGMSAAARPGRGQESCSCCGGTGEHGDGSSCGRCGGTGTTDKGARDPHCPGQPQPRRKHWRSGVLEHFEAGTGPRFYHGTTHPFQPDDMVTTGMPRALDRGWEGPSEETFFTESPGWARDVASQAAREQGRPPEHARVFEVEPTGEHKPDRWNPRSHYSEHPLRVIREVTGGLMDHFGAGYETASPAARERREDRISDWVNRRADENGVVHFPHSWGPHVEPHEIPRLEHHGWPDDLDQQEDHWRHMAPERVSLRQQIHVHQPFVHADTMHDKQLVDRYEHETGRPYDEEPARFVRHEGRTYLLDGHHRYARARLTGKSSMEGVVADTSRESDQPRNCPECQEMHRDDDDEPTRHEGAADQVDLYHHTTPENAAAIRSQRRMIDQHGKQGPVFFSDVPHGFYGGGYGPEAVHVRVPRHLATENDSFGGGTEKFYTVRASDLKPEHFVSGEHQAAVVAHFEAESGEHVAAAADDSQRRESEERLSRALSGPALPRPGSILPSPGELYGGRIEQHPEGGLTLSGKPVSKLYRVADPGEWDDAQHNGYLQSRGGYTRASAAPDERWRHQGETGVRGHTLEIDYHPDDKWHASAEGYAATRSQIPLPRVRRTAVADHVAAEPNRAVHAAVEAKVSQEHPHLGQAPEDRTGTLRKMLGQASFFMPREDIDSAVAPEHGSIHELAHHAAHVMTDKRQALEEARPRESWDRHPRPSDKDPDERRHGRGFTWHYALALDGAGHEDAAALARRHYTDAKIQVANDRHGRGLSRDFPGSGLSPHRPPDLSHLPPMIDSQREGLAAADDRDYSRKMLDVASRPEPGLRLWRGERRPAGEDISGTRSLGMHWSAKPEGVITGPERGGPSTRPVVWQSRLEHPESQAISRSHPMWRGRHESLPSEAEVRLHPGSSVHVEGAWVGEPGKEGTVHPLHPEHNPPGWTWHPVDRHVPVSHRPGQHGTVNYTDVGIPKEGALHSRDELPADPGTAEIPAGRVRLWHYTPLDNVDSIRQHGLQRSRARGDAGDHNLDDPSAGVWASTKRPDDILDDHSGHAAVVEYHAHPDEISGNAESPWHARNKDGSYDQGKLREWGEGHHHVIMRGDVHPRQMLAVHEPWHGSARYMRDDRNGPESYSWVNDETDSVYEPYRKGLRALEKQKRTAALEPAVPHEDAACPDCGSRRFRPPGPGDHGEGGGRSPAVCQHCYGMFDASEGEHDRNFRRDMDALDRGKRGEPARGPYYHGTNDSGDPDQITPQGSGRRNFPQDHDGTHAFATADPGSAWDYAERAAEAHGGRPRVFEVTPHADDVEKDPTHDEGGNSRRVNPGDVRSRTGFGVHREMPVPEHIESRYDEEDEGWGDHEAALGQPADPYVLYHGAHHDDTAGIQSGGLRPAQSPDQPTVTTSRDGAALIAGQRDWTSPRVVEIHVPRDQVSRYLSEPREATEGTVHALREPLPASFIHQVHEAAAAASLPEKAQPVSVARALRDMPMRIASYQPQSAEDVVSMLHEVPGALRIVSAALGTLAARCEHLPLAESMPDLLRQMSGHLAGTADEAAEILRSTEGAWTEPERKALTA